MKRKTRGKRNCIFCGKPLKINIGAEHVKCALKHLRLSLRGWFFTIEGLFFPAAREKAEQVKEKIRKLGLQERKMPEINVCDHCGVSSSPDQ